MRGAGALSWASQYSSGRPDTELSRFTLRIRRLRYDNGKVAPRSPRSGNEQVVPAPWRDWSAVSLTAEPELIREAVLLEEPEPADRRQPAGQRGDLLVRACLPHLPLGSIRPSRGYFFAALGLDRGQAGSALIDGLGFALEVAQYLELSGYG